MSSKYSLVIAVAKRAKQLREGAPALVECESKNPIVIAMEEIAAGKVQIIIPTVEQVEAAERERRGLGPVEKPQAPPVSELLKIEPDEEVDLAVEELEDEEEGSEGLLELPEVPEFEEEEADEPAETEEEE